MSSQREHVDQSCRLNEQTPDESVKCRLNGYRFRIIVRAAKERTKIELVSHQGDEAATLFASPKASAWVKSEIKLTSDRGGEAAILFA